MAYDIEIKLAPKQSWFTSAESNAYYKTRYSREGVACHWWGGNEGADQHDNIVNYFLKQGALGVKSVNYVVSDKKITMMVDPDDVAWCSQGGNPTTISIEHQPTLSDEGYKRSGWLIASLEKRYGHRLSIYPHSKWFATACPGSIDLARLRREADAASGAALPSAPATPVVPTPVPAASKQTVHLPASVATWRAYKVGSAYRPNTSDQVGLLLPSKYGGLTYDIVQNLGNVVVIDTNAFGRIAIWVAGTEARISSSAVNAQPASPTTGTVTFPASVPSWRVYKVGSGYRANTSDQVGLILPAKYGGLTYPIVENRGNVVVIDTQSFGRVAAWIQGTEVKNHQLNCRCDRTR
jgi:hypothetical protein